jgi:molecular chaperone DnaK (HSP70)
MAAQTLGIDLGTTNSVVATVDDAGDVVILPNAIGENTTPSVVYFEDGSQVVIGAEAKENLAIDPDNGVALVKRLMGTDAPIIIKDQSHTPESISALILRQLVAAATTDASARAVITVPAFFGTAEREATYQAAGIAGLSVLALLDEPVAAAIHYGLTGGRDQTILVYDLGGGTFDTTVLKVESGSVTVLATDGHNALGGADVDSRLVELVLGRMESGLPAGEHDAFLEDPTLLGQLTIDVEKVKRALSSASSRDLVIRTPHDRISVTVTRDDLESACRDLFEQTSLILDRVLASARAKGVTAVDEVIMVGGSSRIPTLTDRLRVRLGVTPKLVEPDLAVAKGAARYADRLTRPAGLTAAPSRPASGPAGLAAATPEVTAVPKVTTVAPRGMGVLIDDSYDPAGERTFVEHLIHANDSLPLTTTTSGFGTILDNQETVRIQVFEQAGSVESPETEHNRRVLDGELTGLGELPAGSVIELTMDVAVDGRLTVTAREPRSGKTLTLEAFVEGVIDSAESDRLSAAVGLIAVRG